MAGVGEQVNTEVNKSLAEHGFPTMKLDHQQLLKGQICAITEPHDPIYKLMSESHVWHYQIVFSIIV